MMYQQITYTYYTYTTNISQKEKKSRSSAEMEKFDKNLAEIFESMSSVCIFFHAAETLERENLFNPGASIFFKH